MVCPGRAAALRRSLKRRGAGRAIKSEDGCLKAASKVPVGYWQYVVCSGRSSSARVARAAERRGAAVNSYQVAHDVNMYHYYAQARGRRAPTAAR